MNETYEKYKAFDKAFKGFELTLCVSSILFVTFLVTPGIVLKNFFGFSFPWTEELCQYIMVWMACIGDVVSVEKHEYVSVGTIYNTLPRKLHSYYRMILVVIATVFLAAFAYFPYLEVVFIKATARTSATIPWFQMWWMYLGTVMSCGLTASEYFKTIFVLFKEGKIKAGVDTKDQDLSEFETM